MILYNVRDLSKQIFFGVPPEDNSLRIFLARAILESVIEIFNHPKTENTVITELQEVWENDYDVMGLNELILKLLLEIKQRAGIYGWDPRCLGRLEYMGSVEGRGMLMARIVMDLDQTMAKLLAEVKPVDEGEITEVVSDNPNMETLNELSAARSRETQRPFELLPGRSQPFVRNDEEKGWRTVEWDAKGITGVP